MTSSFWPLFALAVGAFGIGTTEFAPMGLLPLIAASLHVSIPVAGQLVTAYAVGVMLGAPLVTLLLAPLRRKAALIALMGLFTVGNVASAIAPGYDGLLAARVLTSLAHGAFFGLGSVEAMAVVAAEKRASAVATMLMGLTIANIGGVPAATWLGHSLGWRPAFLATGALGVLAMLCLLLALPAGVPGRRPDVRREVAALFRPAVQTALLTTSLASGAMFTLYTYIAPVLSHVTGAGPTLITAALVVTGIGFTLGNWIGGRGADRNVEGSLSLFLVLLALVLLLFPFLAETRPGAILAALLWGTATFAMMPSLQVRVMAVAHEAPGLGASVNIGAFNLGNAFGALLGGLVLSFHLGYVAVPMAGALLCLLALVLVRLRRPAAAPAQDGVVVSGAQ
ncbi:MAG: MFS transporter [Gluconacetobacter diazotrophicus]|nr:MFS transporter [Gluconacetobacter diazotrophicus]